MFIKASCANFPRVECMQDNEKSNVGVEKLKKEDSMIPLLTWVAIGIVVGLVVYLLLPSPTQPLPPPTGNLTNNSQISNVTTPSVKELNIKFIDDPDCKGCNASSALLTQLNSVAGKFNLKVASISTVNKSSSEAQELLSKYSITKIPSFVITSNESIPTDFITSWSQIGTQETDGTLVLREVYPPYFDVQKEKVVGFVDIVEIPAAGCPECFNTSEFTNYLAGTFGVAFSNRTVLAENSSDALLLLSKYNITRLPAFLFSEDASLYPYIQQSWEQFGTVEPDGRLVYRSTIPPYKDLAANKTVGIVTLIELVDQNCTSCYNVSVHHDTLRNSVGMYFFNRTTLDVNSSAGAELVQRYNITEVPTIILSSDALIYPGLNQSWTQMGSIEKDGWLVFRSVDKLGVTYKDLLTGNVTTGTPPAAGG